MWTVTRRPIGSTAAIAHPSGLAGLSRRWEYAYVDGLVPTFSPDVAGTYALQLQGVRGLPDRAYPQNNEATAQVRLQIAP